MEFYEQDHLSYCPACGSRRSDYLKVPEHQRSWVNGRTENTVDMPAVQDHKCRNCGHEWSMEKPE